MREYAALGVENFILSGYPHLEEAYRTAELLFPALQLTPQGQRISDGNITGPFGELVANEYSPPAPEPRPLRAASES